MQFVLNTRFQTIQSNYNSLLQMHAYHTVYTHYGLAESRLGLAEGTLGPPEGRFGPVEGKLGLAED